MPKDRQLLEGKIALITGGGRGIGKSVALAFAREGADIVITARTDAQLNASLRMPSMNLVELTSW